MVKQIKKQIGPEGCTISPSFTKHKHSKLMWHGPGKKLINNVMQRLNLHGGSNAHIYAQRRPTVISEKLK